MKMLPYPSVSMDYPGFGPSSFNHSWLVTPSQADLCAYKQLPQHQNISSMQPMEPGILELRKEKSRDAARSRRGKENYEFYELAKMLPLPAAITSQLDKASIIRLTISYLKLRDFSSHGDPPWTRENSSSNKVLKGASRRTSAGLALEMFEQHQGTHILQSLDGFALAVAADGRFLYISETVSIYLGLSQVEMTGSSIFDYVHLNDHAEIAEQLGLSLTGQNGLSSPGSGTSDDGTLHGTNNPDVSSQMSLNSSTPFKGFDRSFCVRMKSTLTKRGCHFKSSGYRVVLMICRLRPQYTFSHNRKAQPPLLGMVALAIALPPPSVHEIRLESDMFVTRINFDFQIAHCEPKVTELLDYTAEELAGKNLYSLCHGEDANKLRKCHMDLITKGQVLTHYYRIMNKNGGYTWIQTCATVVCSSKNADEQNIICVNYVISAKEYSNLVLDCCQQETVKMESTDTIRDESGAKSPDDDPTNDKGPQGSNLSSRNLTSPKSESSDQHASKTNINHNTRSSNNVQNTNIANEASPGVTVKETGSTRGRKRKQKSENVPETSKSDAKIQIKTNLIAEKQTAHHLPEQTESSVKELENVMSKHLPSPTTLNTTTDFSTDTLLKQQEHQQEKSSTIQWIGPNAHLQQGTMPATALLRQLYANRESVIRATSRPVGSAIYTDSTQGGTLLPTPPGSETSSYDSQFLLQKPPDAFSSLVSAYGTYTSSVDYHNAMTPPSSVSPRDNTSNNNNNNNNNNPKSSISLQTSTSLFEYSSDALRGQYGPESMHQLPLKPQPYSAAVMHHNPIEAAYSSLDQAQFFPHHSGFHLYKNSTSAGWGV